MSTTVATPDGYTVTSTHEDAASITEAFSAPEPEAGTRVIVDKGKPVKDEPEKDKAAVELGRKGGKAAAEARAKAEKEAKGKDTEAAEGKTAAPEVEEAESEAQPEEGKDKRGNPRHDPQARVAQATREAREARESAERAAREASELRRELDRIRQERQPAPGQEQRQQTHEAPAKPQSGDFATYDEYTEALADWKMDRKLEALSVRAQAHQEASRYASEVDGIARGWQDRLTKAEAEDPEFKGRAAHALSEIGLPTRLLGQGQPSTARNWIADYLTSAGDNARDLLLHLSEHKSDLQRIAALSKPHDVARELAKLEVTLSDAATGDTSSEREVSKAKPPVRSLTGTPRTADESPRDEDDYDTHVRKMNALEKSKRAAR